MKQQTASAADRFLPGARVADEHRAVPYGHPVHWFWMDVKGRTRAPAGHHQPLAQLLVACHRVDQCRPVELDGYTTQGSTASGIEAKRGRLKTHAVVI